MPSRIGMALLSQIQDAEHLFARGRERVQLPAHGVERLVEAALAFGFLIVALAMALLLPFARPLDVSTLA
ncbi:MAG: hypothetical protein ACREMY_09805, partial [bacterium]